MAGTPDLNLLPVFVAVAETAGMSAAARRLGLPKSSVSRGIAALEASLGVQLFHRTTRKVALTTAGLAFYEKARPLLASLGDLTGGLPEQEAEPSGELRLTTPIDMALTFLPILAAEFVTRHPGVRLDIRPTNRYVDLVAEGFDAALRVADKLADSTMVMRRLSSIEAGLYASPTYLARRGQVRTPAETASHDWVLFSGLQIPPPLVAPAAVRLATDDLLFAHAAIREGMGLGIVPTFIAAHDVVSGLLVRVLPRWSTGAGALHFVYPQTGHVPRKVSAFRDFIVDFLATRPLVSRNSG